MTELPPRPPRRRMLPSVSDVVRELSLVSTADPALLFKVARQVCAEELNRVKQGFESEPLEVLVDRAKGLLDPATLKTPSPPAPEPDLFEDGNSPFESTAAMDLRWDQIRSSFSDVIPIPEGARTAAEMTEAVPFGAEPPPAPPAEAESQAEPEPLPEPEGPGESTLARLRREADSVQLSEMPQLMSGMSGASAPPEPQPETLRLEEPFSGPEPEPAAPSREPWAAEKAPPTPRFGVPEGQIFTTPKPPRPMGLWAGLALLGVAIAGLWLIFRGSPEPLKQAGTTPAVSVTPEETATESAPVEDTPAPTAVPSPIATVAAPAPTAPATPVPTRAPAVALAASPVPTRPAAQAPPATGQARAARILTPDWVGKAPTYVIHFSSYKDRPSAEREAASLGKRLGQSGHAVEVDLGERGLWYRVLIGEFDTVEEAQAYRRELEERKTPNMGFVYRVEAKP